MAANNNPIFTAAGDIQGPDQGLITTNATTDYTGTIAGNFSVFKADDSNGGFVQRLRFKATGTNAAANVARIYISPTGPRGIWNFTPSTPTGVSNNGVPGTIFGDGSRTMFARLIYTDQMGNQSLASAEGSVLISNATDQRITWTFTPVNLAASWRLFVGSASGVYTSYFTAAGAPPATYQQTTAFGSTDVTYYNRFIGEVGLPITAVSAVNPTQDIDYPLNIAVPAGYHIVVGFGTAPSVGWAVTAIGGKY